jgi:4-amino-4-deoxy-L-arabinose transferase-like glycosyltransferase
MLLWRSGSVLVLAIVFFATAASLIRFVFNQKWRLAIIQTFVVLGAIAWLISESLGALKAITFWGFAGFWGVIGLAMLIVIIKNREHIFDGNVMAEARKLQGDLKKLPISYVAVLIFISLAILFFGIITFVAAPENFDAMTYHLSRVMHWIQNRSLDFYPTNIICQLYLSPMAEILVLNFQVFSGGDYLVGFVQFFSMIGCVVGVSLLTEILGGNLYAQIFSALSVIAIPMGILQSASPQTDYAVGLWVVCFVVLVLLQMKEKPSLVLSFLTGLSLGLALNTKATAFLYIAPFGLWFAYWLVKQLNLNSLKFLSVLLVTAFMIVAPQALRNYLLFGNPLGLPSRYVNQIYSPAALASNYLRNLGLHFGTPVRQINALLENTIVKVHDILGISVNDPRTTFEGTKFSVNFVVREGSVGNPLHLILIFIAIPMIVYQKRRDAILYLICLAAGFTLFCLILKWQPWNSRLQLPLFVLAMPMVSLSLSAFFKRWPVDLLMLLLAVETVFYVSFNLSRPVFGRNSIFVKDRAAQYFSNQPARMLPYENVAKAANALKCDRIGLMTGSDDWEYPIWALLDMYGKNFTMEHIKVENQSGKLEGNFVPCAIIVTYPQTADTIVYQGKTFTRSISSSVNLYVDDSLLKP